MKIKWKNKEVDFYEIYFGILLGTLAVRLLEHMLAVKGVTQEGDGVTRAGQDF